MTTILLVEDETFLREGVQELLGFHDDQVICAGHGAEALACLALLRQVLSGTQA